MKEESLKGSFFIWYLSRYTSYLKDSWETHAVCILQSRWFILLIIFFVDVWILWDNFHWTFFLLDIFYALYLLNKEPPLSLGATQQSCVAAFLFGRYRFLNNVMGFRFDTVHFNYGRIILSSPKRQNLNGGLKLGKWESKLNGSWLLTSHYPHWRCHSTNINPWPWITPSSHRSLIPPHAVWQSFTKI